MVPYWILGEKVGYSFMNQLMNLGIHSFGLLIFVVGFVVMLWCIVSFAVQGRGTLSPIDPTKKLVIVGLYKFSRNPMYVGVALMLIGEAMFFKSANLWIYSLLVLVVFHVFIILVEEPRLKKDFGEEYKAYCAKVGRWI